MGETRSISMVPVSFSRVIEIAVIIADTMVSTKATSPGTNRWELSRVGLYLSRLADTIRSPPPAGEAWSCQRCTTAVA
jgi:hypothetical protein